MQLLLLLLLLRLLLLLLLLRLSFNAGSLLQQLDCGLA